MNNADFNAGDAVTHKRYGPGVVLGSRQVIQRNMYGGRDCAPPTLVTIVDCKMRTGARLRFYARELKRTVTREAAVTT